MREPKPDQADTTAPCRLRLAMGCTLMHQYDPLLRRAQAQLAGHGRWDDLTLGRWHSPTSSSSDGCEHRISPSRPETNRNSWSSRPCRSDTLLKPCRLHLAGIVTLFAHFHKICREGAIGGSVGSGREITLHFFSSLLFRHNGTVAYHPGGLRA
jgi:hypothetical protein